MSTKRPKRLSSKKRKPPKENAQAEMILKLGLGPGAALLDSASMLNINTWAQDNPVPQEAKDLPSAFLQRLWLLNPDARSPRCTPPPSADKPVDEMVDDFAGDCPVNPLDLVTAVFMFADTFLQQEMVARMVQCRFAVPLILPNVDTSCFLLWPLRGAVRQWSARLQDGSRVIQEGALASTCMPVVSCVKLGPCSISKSQVLNNVLRGLGGQCETFIHRGMDGGQLPRRLSNGLVEVGWYLPSGDVERDAFAVPMAISNLRGDASMHEKPLTLLCQASSGVVVFCENLREKEKQLLVTCKNMASKIILVDLSESVTKENRVVGFVDENLREDLGLPEGSVLRAAGLNEEDLANMLRSTLKKLLPDQLKLVTLETAAQFTTELGLNVDEGFICKKAMATAEEVLNGLDEGSAVFRQKQLPLQGESWSRLGEIDKEESRQRKDGKEVDPRLLRDKRDILIKLSHYRMTPKMKLFTDALLSADVVERTYFLTWMKLRLRMLQIPRPNILLDALTIHQTEWTDETPQHPELENGVNHEAEDNKSLCSYFSVEEGESINYKQQITEQQFVKGQKLQPGLSSGNTTEPESQQSKAEDLESTCNGDMEQEASNTEESPQEEPLGKTVCVEETISIPATDDQKVDLEFIQNGGMETEEPQPTPETSSIYQSTSSGASFEDQVASWFTPSEPLLGLEHFLREMGLIFELTHVSPGSGSHNVLRLPSLAADLILYGIPFELMDGDVSNCPMSWLACVFAEVKRRLPKDLIRTRVLSSLGVHNARNAEIFSALFGVKFPQGWGRSTKGVYLIVLFLPAHLREELACDFLLLIDVEGLCAKSSESDTTTWINDNELATVAAGLSDVLLENLSSDVGSETNLTVMINALLRARERASMPICQILTQDEGINSVLEATQLKHVSDILQNKTRDQNSNAKTRSSVVCVKGPWYNTPLSKPVEINYSKDLLELKRNLFGALRKCADQSESLFFPEFLSRLHALWDAVRSDSFSIGFQNTDTALAFSLHCTKIFQWEGQLREVMENWLVNTQERISAAKDSDASEQNDLLRDLRDEAREEVKTQVYKQRSKVEANLMEDDHLRKNLDTLKPIIVSHMDDVEMRVTAGIIERIQDLKETHCYSSQLQTFGTLLEKAQEAQLQALTEKMSTAKGLIQDSELEEGFEAAWNDTLSKFDFRTSETDDITLRVAAVLRENLLSRCLNKHLRKLQYIVRVQTATFQVQDEHFGYRSRIKRVFENNNRGREEAQKLACKIIKEYHNFVEDRLSLLADFSDSYIAELLENIEKSLSAHSLELRSAFEVDLKVYLCGAACRDFQKVHDRFAKDAKLLSSINGAKNTYLAEFIYSFRKRDQCWRLAQCFTSMVIGPSIMEYIYRPLGMQIVEEIQEKAEQLQSRGAFDKFLLEELLKEDRFESFVEYLHSYDCFRLGKIQEIVLDHLSDWTQVDGWRQQRLGEIAGKIASAVSKTTEGVGSGLSDTKLLLDRLCHTLVTDEDVNVNRAGLEGPLFSITTEWDRFVTYLMELLAAVRLDLSQEFSQDRDVSKLLQGLLVQPRDVLFNRVRGCEKHCPVCRAPCEAEDTLHKVHRSSRHRPETMLPIDSAPVSCICSPESVEQNGAAAEMSMACKNFQALHPDWSISPNDSNGQMSCAYWRYVSARFNERFATQYRQQPALIPEEWKMITQEDALDSLKDTFLLK